MTAGAGIVVTGFEAITPAGMGAARLGEACVTPRPFEDVVTRFDVSRHASLSNAFHMRRRNEGGSR